MPRQIHGHNWRPPDPKGLWILSAIEDQRHRVSPRGRISHAFWALDYAFCPGVTFRVGRVRNPWRERPAFTAHLYAPGTSYWERFCSAGSPLHSGSICFLGGDVAGLARLVDASDGCARFSDPQKIIASLLQRAADVGQQEGDAGFWKAQALLCHVIDALGQAQPAGEDGMWIVDGKARPRDGGEMVPAAREYLRMNLHRTVALREIAVHLHVSVSTLAHRFRRETGRSTLGEHAQMRIRHIKHLLLMGEPLKAIAPVMGFGDIYHLSKYFRRVEGVSPRAFLRQQNRG